MGLDWNPGNKAKPGYDAEFGHLWKKLQSGRCFWRNAKIRRFHAITVPAWDTLNAPRVGFDSEATAWALETFPKRVDKTLTEQKFLENMKGFRVLDIVPRCDGLPRYTNGSPGGYVEAYSFRGQFLRDCIAIIGDSLLESAFVSKLPEETVTYGRELLLRASDFAAEHNLDAATAHRAEDPDSPEFHFDVVQSAGRWCLFWGERGHWLEAYF